MAQAVAVTVVGAGPGGADLEVVVATALFRQAAAHPDGGSEVLLTDPLTSVVVERRITQTPSELLALLNG